MGGVGDGLGGKLSAFLYEGRGVVETGDPWINGASLGSRMGCGRGGGTT